MVVVVFGDWWWWSVVCRMQFLAQPELKAPLPATMGRTSGQSSAAKAQSAAAKSRPKKAKAAPKRKREEPLALEAAPHQQEEEPRQSEPKLADELPEVVKVKQESSLEEGQLRDTATGKIAWAPVPTSEAKQMLGALSYARKTGKKTAITEEYSNMSIQEKRQFYWQTWRLDPKLASFNASESHTVSQQDRQVTRQG